MAWLFDVIESRQPMSEISPSWIRESVVLEGPPIRHPEHHSCCEINILLQGSGPLLVEKDLFYRTPGSLARLGPGSPSTRSNITEAALAVGFESLSHSNATFRSFMGASPKDYVRIAVKASG